jgi:nucleoside 2-deoxyribosyltransferase
MFRGFKDEPLKPKYVCPICISRCDGEEPGGPFQTGAYTCPTCGTFALDDNAYASLNDIWADGIEAGKTAKLYKLSFATRTAAEAALRQPQGTPPLALTVGDLQRILDAPEPSVQDKLNTTLKYCAKATEYPGQKLNFTGLTDYPVARAQNWEEAKFYLHSLREQGMLELTATFDRSPNAECQITTAGWQELNRLEQSGGDSSSAFIAMSFHPDRDPFATAIAEAVIASGYKAVRIDRVEHINRIDDEILARIRSSKFLISDFTGQRNGVYFEAGFMLGLGRPVIWICEKEDLKNVHFDARQYNTIDYTDADDLKKRLQFRIEAIMGKGPNK